MKISTVLDGNIFVEYVIKPFVLVTIFDSANKWCN